MEHKIEGSSPRLGGASLALVVTGLLLTLFLEALDQTVVGTALPKVIASLRGFDRYVWTVTSYILMASVSVPIAGKLSDQFGRKGFLLGGTFLFLLGSALSGAARSMDMLILSRAIQGMGAGTGIALAPVIIADIFPPDERAKWQSLFGVVYGLSSLVGPTLGGFLADQGPLSEPRDRGHALALDLLPEYPLGGRVDCHAREGPAGQASSRSGRFRGWADLRRIDFAGADPFRRGDGLPPPRPDLGLGRIYAWDSKHVLLVLALSHTPLLGLLPCRALRPRAYTSPRPPEKSRLRGLCPRLAPADDDSHRSRHLSPALPPDHPRRLGDGLGGGPHPYEPRLGGGSRDRRRLAGGDKETPADHPRRLGPPLRRRLSDFDHDGGTSLGLAILFMTLAGLGIGPFFSVLTVVAQNSLSAERLGIGTSVLSYLGQLGSVLGAAIVGTVVNGARSPGSTRPAPSGAASRSSSCSAWGCSWRPS